MSVDGYIVCPATNPLAHKKLLYLLRCGLRWYVIVIVEGYPF